MDKEKVSQEIMRLLRQIEAVYTGYRPDGLLSLAVTPHFIWAFEDVDENRINVREARA